MRHPVRPKIKREARHKTDFNTGVLKIVRVTFFTFFCFQYNASEQNGISIFNHKAAHCPDELHSAGYARLAEEPVSALRWQSIRLAKIAPAAGGDDVKPTAVATAGDGNHVITGE